jgi:MFS family permease
MGGRVMLGFGNSLAQMASPMLLTELCHPQHRARFTTVYNCLWNVGALCKLPNSTDDTSRTVINYGFLVVALISFGTDFLKNDSSWRIPAVLQAAPSVIQLLFIYCGFLPGFYG